MIRKYHNHKLQTNPWHSEEEPHNNNTRHQDDKQSKATSSLFPTEMIAKLERTQSITQQNIEQLQNTSLAILTCNPAKWVFVSPRSIQALSDGSSSYVVAFITNVQSYATIGKVRYFHSTVSYVV